ncbi:MAG: topoisomerase, partial [Clostridium sp.]|nr:topoisomerase [Clostridium sp.]
MPYIAPEVVQEAKRMDLLTYLKNYEPFELVHFSGNTYTTKTHDSLKISNGKWMWWSRGIGGRQIRVVSYLKSRGIDTDII